MKKRKHSKGLDVYTRGVPKVVMTLLNLVQQKILPNIEFGSAPQYFTVWLNILCSDRHFCTISSISLCSRENGRLV